MKLFNGAIQAQRVQIDDQRNWQWVYIPKYHKLQVKTLKSYFGGIFPGQIGFVVKVSVIPQNAEYAWQGSMLSNCSTETTTALPVIFLGRLPVYVTDRAPLRINYGSHKGCNSQIGQENLDQIMALRD